MARGVPNTELPTTQLAQIISDAMQEKGLSIRDLSGKLEVTYEHLRRILRGEGTPSKYILRLICEELGLNLKEAERLSTADKIKHKFGNIPAELSGKNPELEPVERVWRYLSSDQKKDLVALANTMAKRSREAAKVGA